MNWWVLKRKVHSSWLIAALCAAIFLGILMARYIQLSSVKQIICVIIAITTIIIVFWRRYVYLIPILIISGLLFGLWRGSLLQNDLTRYERLYGKTVIVEGSVRDDVDTGSSGMAVIRLGNIIIENKSLPGTLYVTTINTGMQRGDKLILSGKLTAGFGSFSGIIYRASIKQIIQPQPSDIARVVRDWFANAIRKVVPEPESSLGIGYLVGQRRALPADLVTALQIVGLTHVVVASGYNLTILVRLARRLFEKVSKYLSALSAVIMIVAFIAITGVSPSMARAGLVSVLCLAAWYYGRKFHPIILLLIAMAITVIINPMYAWGDLGWQLSFAAFAGVMIFAPLATRYFFGDKKPGFIQQILIETVSAQIVTAPIIIMTFGQFSNVAILSNLLVLPLVPCVMLFIFFAGLGALILPLSVATIIAVPSVWLLKYMIVVINYLASFPWAMSVVKPSFLVIVAIYLAIVTVCVCMWRVTKYNLRDSNLVE